MSACPDCGELLGARYKHRGRLVCWPCTGLKLEPEKPPRDPDWVIFRKRIMAALDRIDESRFVYLDKDRIVHVCPVCRAGLPEYLGVRFRGEALRLDAYCSLGCPEAEIADALDLEEAP